MLATLLLCGGALAAVPQQAGAKKVAAGAKTAPVTPAVPFVENSYARVLADAQKRNVPIFVEAWAPW